MTFEFRFQSEAEEQVGLSLGFVIRKSSAAPGTGNQSDRIMLGGTDPFDPRKPYPKFVSPDTSYALILFDFTVRKYEELMDTLGTLARMTEAAEATRNDALRSVAEAASASLPAWGKAPRPL